MAEKEKLLISQKLEIQNQMTVLEENFAKVRLDNDNHSTLRRAFSPIKNEELVEPHKRPCRFTALNLI